MILLFSSLNERFTSLIEEHLKETDLFKFNLDAESLKETVVSIIDKDIIIVQGGRRLETSQISGVWIKRQSILVTSEEEQNYCGFADYCNYKLWKDEWNSVIKQLIIHLSYIGVPFFDEADSIIRGEKKLLQLDVAREVGFNTPSTIISNSRSLIIDFLDQYHDEGILNCQPNQRSTRTMTSILSLQTKSPPPISTKWTL